MADYSKMAQEEFDEILEELVGKMSTAQILSYGEVRGFFTEELSNEVLAEWEERNPEKAIKLPNLSEYGIEATVDPDDLSTLIILLDGDREDHKPIRYAAEYYLDCWNGREADIEICLEDMRREDAEPLSARQEVWTILVKARNSDCDNITFRNKEVVNGSVAQRFGVGRT